MTPETKIKTQKCSSCEGWGQVADPEHGQGQKCEPCRGSGVVIITVDETGKFTSGGAFADADGVVGKPTTPGATYEIAFGRAGSLLETACGVHQCQRQAMPNRKICENHAFPAGRSPKTTGRRAAVLATRKKLAEEEAKVSEDIAEKTKVSESITDGADEEMKGET